MRLTQLTMAVAVAALVVVLASVSARAEIVINSSGQTVPVTFDANVTGVIQMRTGTGATRGVTEADAWDRSIWNGNRALTFCTEGVAYSREGDNPFNRGAGVCGYFGDANNNGNLFDTFGGILAPRPLENALGAGNNALQLNGLNEWANTRTMFRIRNNSGGTLGQWIFTFDVYGADNDNNNSTVNYRYAVNNSNDPEAMTFTTMGSVQIPNNGGTVQLIASVGVTQNVSVANGGYIVLSFETVRVNSGSASYINDLTVTGIVPEPGVIGLAALALVVLRRK